MIASLLINCQAVRFLTVRFETKQPFANEGAVGNNDLFAVQKCPGYYLLSITSAKCKNSPIIIIIIVF